MPTGATVAALTTSLPETPGGERNWDYRYTWMRDTTFTLQALHFLNLDWEADEFMQFVADLEPNPDGGLQIMYGIDGRRDLTESTRDELSGYEGARPVRLGNGAFDQRQNDVYGAVLDSLLLHTRRSKHLPRRLWPLVKSQAEGALASWREPDQGIWEARGAPQHYVSSKLMGWVALDRAAKLAAIRDDAELEKTWAAAAEEIRADILEHGVSDRGVLRQHYDTDALDASTLLAAIFGFLPGSDERMKNTVDAISSELTENGFVLRYVTGETDDGLSGKEGTFLICSFWLVSALAIVGEMQQATDLMERLLRIASPLGLYAEEFEVDRARHLGNFPQAFSHLALIEAAGRIILADRLEEMSSERHSDCPSLKEASMTTNSASPAPLHHPGPPGPAELESVPHPDGLRSRRRLDPGRAADHHLELGDRGAEQPETLGMTSTEIGADRLGLPGRRDGRRAGVRPAVRPARPQAAADRHPAALPARHRAAAFTTGHHTGWLLFFYATRFIAGMGIGGQYAAINSAIDEMMPSKYRGRVDIWINGTLLGRRDHRLVRLADLPQRLRRQRRLAAGVPDGPGARPGRHRGRPHPAGEPAMADDPRPAGGGRERAGEDRGRCPQVRRRDSPRWTTARRSG